MGTIKINNIVYGSNNASEIIYKSQTVEEKLDTIPIFDINDNGNVDSDNSDVLTYGHIVDSLNSDAVDKTLSAKQGKVLKNYIDNIDFSPLENSINSLESELEESIDNLDTSINNLDTKITEFQNTFLNLVYPIGAIYLSLNDTDPGSLFGGVWEKICQGRTLFGADDTYNPGDLIEAGLPNIIGEIHANTNYSGSPYSGNFSGAFHSVNMINTQYYLNGRGVGNGWTDIGFDASRSNSIYGKSNTVQPPALVINIWKRVS